MDIISRMDAYRAGKRRFFTGRACKHGHTVERYVSTGGCVQCAVPLKFRQAVYDERDMPFFSERLWVRKTYTLEQRKALDVYLQQCIDTFDRATCPDEAPLMRSPPTPSALTIEAAPGKFEALPDTAPPEEKRGPGRPRNPDRCVHGVDAGFCEVCDE